MVLTSTPDHGRHTTYFDETWHLDAGESRSYEDDDGVTIGDYPPEVMALAVTDDETTARSVFTVGSATDEIRVAIAEDGQIELETDTDESHGTRTIGISK